MKSIFFKDSFPNIEKSVCDSTGISTLALMENAGRSCAEYLIDKFTFDQLDNLIILAGNGNNAGDGFVIARHLITKGIMVNIALLFGSDTLKGIAGENYRILERSSGEMLRVFDCKNSESVSGILNSANVVIDCIFGIGFSGELDESTADVVTKVNELSHLKRISVDIPSGLTGYMQSSTCFNADITLTMGAEKLECMFYEGKKYSGDVHVMNIGIPQTEFDNRQEGLFVTEPADLKKDLLQREVTSNKYSNGKLLIIAGSPGLSGAAYLSSQSAIRTGCGAVITAIPDSVAEVIEQKLTEVMKFPLLSNNFGSISFKAFEHLHEKIDWADVVLIGPGLSKNEETLELVRRMLIEHQGKKFVIDADAIFAFKGFSNLLKGKDVILTPHFGEFTGVCELNLSELKSNFIKESKEFTERTGITLVLKNAPTIIADSGNIYVNPTGRENLATAGSGDVLSGMISAMWAKSGMRFESAIAGTYLHGYAGDILYTDSGPNSTIAGDLISAIPASKRDAGFV